MSTQKTEKAIFERFTEPGDQLTGESGVWTELFREFISLNPLSGRELLLSQQVEAQVSHRARVHWSETTSVLHPKDRFKIARPVVANEEDPNDDANYRIFNIESVINIGERNREIELMCKEVV